MQRHKRSKSCSGPLNKSYEDETSTDSTINASQRLKLDLPRCCHKSVDTKKNLSSDVKAQSSLKQEILELERRLQNQFDVRGALENVLGYKTPSRDIITDSTPKPAIELIKEISVLELEVSHLEQYLLSLYRKAFDQQAPRQLTSCSPLRQKRLDFFSTTLESPRCFSFDNRLKEPASPPRQFNQESSRIDSRCFSFDNRFKDQSYYDKENTDSCVRRCQSSLNQRSTFKNQISPPVDKHIMTPNKLSEEMIKCVSAIYSKLADPQSINNGFSSPSSSPSSTSEFSPREQYYDMWSPTFNDFSGPYSSMIEVSSSYIHRNNRKGRDCDMMNRNFSLLVKRLKSVNIRKMTHQEKLPFWINVHNALVMHIFLVNGIPQNNGKRFLLLSKPIYNIGGRMISVEAIQSHILGIRMPRPGQWLKLLHMPRKFRTGDEYRDYSLDHSEPLLYFALSSGNHSDPAIRVYTPKGIYQELETAKEEYICARIGVKKDEKLVLPKIIESFSKDSALSQVALMEMIQGCIPEDMKKTLKTLNSGRSRKSVVEWTPHSFMFRYLIARELC